MKPTILLFDIDGTLITTGGVGRRALEDVFRNRYGRADACAHFRLDGMTDRAIVRQGLSHLGIEPRPEEVEQVLKGYIEILELEVAQADSSIYRIHPGMKRAIEQAVTLPWCAVGLGTGNIRDGARVKLTKVDLYQHFAFGGFGCDHEDRPTLIRMGAERGAKRLNSPLGDCRVVVIGDTPKDVAAAQSIGAECIGVGTGSFSVEELLSCGAHHAFPDLSAPGAVEVLIGPG